MAKTEKKFRVNSFDEIKNKLASFGISKSSKSSSTHYYSPMTDGLLTKLVEDHDGVRITQMRDVDGTFEFVKREYVESLKDGLAWMKENGFSDLKKVSMRSELFPYNDGHVELVDINEGKLLSAILYFEPSEHLKMAREFGLASAEPIEVPYSELV